MSKKAWDISAHDCIAGSFYPTRDGTGGAFRETFTFLCKKGDHLNGRYLNMARRRTEKLKAKNRGHHPPGHARLFG
jgi:hypothetical protein